MNRVKCSRCGAEFDINDKDFDKRKSRHVDGRHTRHTTQNERYPESEPKMLGGGIGGLNYGPVEWIPIWTYEDTKLNHAKVGKK